jgi:ADYC domain-containing protein
MCSCAVNEDTTFTIDQALISPNGTSANAISPSLISPNGGASGSAIRLSSVRPSGLRADGTPITIADTGAPLAGADLVGSTWTGNVSDGTTVALRIDAAAPGNGANAELWSYRVSAAFDGTWRPLCVDAVGVTGFADSVGGSWNLAQGVLGGGAYHAGTAEFTLACRGSAIAKCVELGYKPWTGLSVELAACVRALRGDYCGDGTPYTVDGTLVNLYDRAGVVPDGVAWTPEAEWTANGARCVSKKKATRFSQAADAKPSCYPHALKPSNTCGSGFGDDVAIITELPPQ